MTESTDDKLTEMLEDGWVVAGYSACLMAAGLFTHHVLMQKDSKLEVITIVTGSKDKEVGRNVRVLAPKVDDTKKKGIWG